MLLDMTISNYRSVQTPQTISFQAIKDNRLDDEKIVEVSDKMKVIKSCAIIGPNGAGKSTFVRALEALKAIITADKEVENPVSLLAGTSFAYTDEKGLPSQMTLHIIMGYDEESGEPLTGKYTLVATRDKIYDESY
jgi:AAA15 family ATPase/GTPase